MTKREVMMADQLDEGCNDKSGYVNLLLFYASLRCGKTTQKIKLSTSLKASHAKTNYSSVLILKHSNSLVPC